MLIRFGLGGQMSGSVGGVTAGHNKGGQYLRNRSIPTNPNSTRQQAARSALGTASQRWKTLTVSQRAAWEAYATQTPVNNRLGESITLSGIAMYVRTNSFLLAAGSAVIDDAPTTPGQSNLGTVTDTAASEGSETITFTLEGGEALDPVIVQIGPPVSQGVNSFNGPYTTLGYHSSDGTTIVADFNETRYGVPQLAERRPYRLRGCSAAGKLSNVAQGFVSINV